MRFFKHIYEEDSPEALRLKKQILDLQNRIDRERNNIDPDDEIGSKEDSIRITRLEIQLSLLKDRLEKETQQGE